MLNNTGNIKVQVPGKGLWTLTQNDHVATGGEGSVYISKGYAFKILLDPSIAASASFQDRITLLSKLGSSRIISPKDLVLDDRGNTIGYYMEAFSGEPLVKSFATPWRKRNSFDDSDALKLCEEMWLANKEAHDIGAIIVDGNDTNYLFQPKARLALIDVDSWQIGPHKATAIKDSVRDFSVNRFDENTDWFSWGVVSFQVFTGIHPYQGTHPGYKPGQMVERMRANASVFDTGVSLSKAVRDFSLIPANLKAWYEAVFQKGFRGEPPQPSASTMSVTSPKSLKVRATSTSGNLKQVKIYEFPYEIVAVLECGVIFTRGAELKAWHYRTPLVPPVGVDITSFDIERILKGEGVILEFNGRLCSVIAKDGGITLRACDRAGEATLPASNPASREVKLGIEVDKIFMTHGKIFGTQPSNPMGVVEIALSNSWLLYTVNSWPVSTKSSKFFSKVIVSDVLGMPHVIELGDGFHSYKASCLREFDVIDAASLTEGVEGGLMVLANHKTTGQTHKLLLRKTSTGVIIDEDEVVDYQAMNLAVREDGLAADLSKDGELQIRRPNGSTAVKILSSSLDSDLTLSVIGSGFFYIDGKSLYQLRLN